ncbi:hypothetical protein DFH08DRAFT_880971, partial [Mycena albidolilacea]
PPAHAHPSVVPVGPSCLAERRVRRASRPSTLPIARTGLLQQHDITRDALADYEVTSRLLDAPRAYDLTPNAVPRPHPLHQAPMHPRDATRQALLFFDVRIALGNPRAQRRSSPGSAPSVFSARACMHRSWDLRHHCRVQCLYIRSPITYTAFLSCTICTSAAHPHARVAPAVAAHHSRLLPDSALSSRRLRLRASPAGPALVPSARQVSRFPSRACHSLPLRSLRRPRHPSALSLRPPTRRAATASSAASASTSYHSAASPSSPHRTLRRSSWYYPAVALATIAGAHAISIDFF